jgi:hypothetical protein
LEKLNTTEVTVASDEWRTLKRVLPKDVYDIFIEAERAIAEEQNIGTEALGSSVQVYTTLAHFLLENMEHLRAKAREFNDDPNI